MLGIASSVGATRLLLQVSRFIACAEANSDLRRAPSLFMQDMNDSYVTIMMTKTLYSNAIGLYAVS